MDVLLRLRVLIWALVIGLWGVMVYQYLGDEERERVRMRPIVNPYASIALSSAPMRTSHVDVAAAPERSDPATMVTPPPDAVSPAPGGGHSAEVAVTTPPRPRQTPSPSRPVRPLKHEEDFARMSDPTVPPGFEKIVTRHFNVYAEQSAASDRFIQLLENLHANLMLDLAPFSPWARDQRVSIFLFRNQDTYRAVTGRPIWSAGASSVPKRKVYVYESDELPGILAHELTHIYFDGFFLGGTTDPLWLSEGMATLVQVERGLAAPNWLRENLVRMESGEVLPLEELMGVRGTSGWSDERVRLWYAQSFSIVRYLIRIQYRSSFYKFAASLREGRSAPESLYRAYGPPYTRLRALDIAWRHEIIRRKTPRYPSLNIPPRK